MLLDSYSRRVIGWALGRTLRAELTLAALGMALRQRQPVPGLVHHSDRGVQYACRAYTALLQQHTITSSMSRKGNPYDNAQAESFIKTLKYEEVYRTEYRDLADAYASIGEFIERVYNEKRLHWAIGRRPSSSSRRRGCHEVAPRRHACLGAPLPNPWDLPLSGQNGCRRNARFWRWPKPPPAIPATESALGLRPRRALSSAQPPPEWTTSTLPCNTFAANGNYPLN